MCEWKIIMSPVLQKIDHKWINCQSSGEVNDTSSLHFCRNEVTGEMAHCIRQGTKGNMGAIIYLFNIGKFNTNSTESFQQLHFLWLYFSTIHGKACVFVYLLSFQVEGWFRYKNYTLLNLFYTLLNQGSKQEKKKPALHVSSAVIREGYCN